MKLKKYFCYEYMIIDSYNHNQHNIFYKYGNICCKITKYKNNE